MKRLSPTAHSSPFQSDVGRVDFSLDGLPEQPILTLLYRECKMAVEVDASMMNGRDLSQMLNGNVADALQ